MKNEGMPAYKASSQTGDLHVTFNVRLPSVLSTDDKENLLKIFSLGKWI